MIELNAKGLIALSEKTLSGKIIRHLENIW